MYPFVTGAYFTEYNALEVHSCGSLCQNFLFFLSLSNILCIYTDF